MKSTFFSIRCNKSGTETKLKVYISVTILFIPQIITVVYFNSCLVGPRGRDSVCSNIQTHNHVSKDAQVDGITNLSRQADCQRTYTVLEIYSVDYMLSLLSLGVLQSVWLKTSLYTVRKERIFCASHEGST